MKKFYCIKLINNSTGARGWLIDRPNGIEICVGAVTSDITQFDTQEDALNFIRERKIERGGIKAYVRTSSELLDESIESGDKGVRAIPTEVPIYYLENHKGEKCFYDSKMEAYYFKKIDAGYPCWNNEEHLRLFVKEARFEQPMIYMVKQSGKDKKEKIPIQAYGCRKNPDGTMGEPEQIEIKAGDEIKNPFDGTVN